MKKNTLEDTKVTLTIIIFVFSIQF